jgi:hypothetical protein
MLLYCGDLNADISENNPLDRTVLDVSVFLHLWTPLTSKTHALTPSHTLKTLNEYRRQFAVSLEWHDARK